MASCVACTITPRGSLSRAAASTAWPRSRRRNSSTPPARRCRAPGAGSPGSNSRRAWGSGCACGPLRRPRPGSCWDAPTGLTAAPIRPSRGLIFRCSSASGKERPAREPARPFWCPAPGRYSKVRSVPFCGGAAMFSARHRPVFPSCPASPGDSSLKSPVRSGTRCGSRNASALHGIRPVTSWSGEGLTAAPPRRAAGWQARLMDKAVPVDQAAETIGPGRKAARASYL